MMDTTDRIELAKQLSKHFHKGQKYGEDDYYEYHILGVVKTLELVAKEVTEDMVIVALLHDVLEDTTCGLGTLENIFNFNVCNAVLRLSNISTHDYSNYIDHVLKDDTTRIVKYADSLFNHTECVKVGDKKRAEKYQHNLNVLYSKELLK